jgi:D-serine deaminase-like pyridoxal phosphate-dependent protein
MMAFPAVDPLRCRLLAKLARKKTVRVVVDTAAAIQALGEAAQAARSTIGVLVDRDVGLGRTGVGTNEEALVLAQLIDRTPGLRLDGLLCYPGHVWADHNEQGGPLGAVSAILDEVLALWSRHGLQAKIVAGGSTPTAYQSHLVKSFTEIHPGTYIFNDMNTVRGGYCALEDCAARFVCTVVSDAVRNQVVLDAGSKTFTSDLCVPARDSGHGYIVEYPAAKITRLSEEHGQVDVSLCDPRPKVGERVTVVPNHICPCVNLQDFLWWSEPGKKARRVPVDARGKLL